MTSGGGERPRRMDEAAAIIASTDYMTLATADADLGDPDSRVRRGAAAVYFDAVAEQVDDGIETYHAYSVEHGRGEWTRRHQRAQPAAPLPRRGHRAVAAQRGRSRPGQLLSAAMNHSHAGAVVGTGGQPLMIAISCQ